MNNDLAEMAMASAPRRRWSRLPLRVGVVTAVVLGAAAGGYGVATAATGPSHVAPSMGGGFGHGPFGGTPPAAAGTVTEGASLTTATACLSGDTQSFVVKTRSGTSDTVTVTSSTTYSDPGVSTPTFVKVCVGDNVAITGTLAAATKVLIFPAGGGFGIGPFGRDPLGGFAGFGMGSGPWRGHSTRGGFGPGSTA
jgi:hypothetical protein